MSKPVLQAKNKYKMAIFGSPMHFLVSSRTALTVEAFSFKPYLLTDNNLNLFMYNLKKKYFYYYHYYD